MKLSHAVWGHPRWTEMGEFNSDDHYTYYCGQESPRRNGVAIMANKKAWNAVLGCNLKNDRMISVRFQGKPFSITVIQVCAPTSNAKEAEVEWFCEDLQDLLEITLKPKSDWLYTSQPKMWNLSTVSKNKTGSWLWLRSWTPYCQIYTKIEESREDYQKTQVWPKSCPLRLYSGSD